MAFTASKPAGTDIIKDSDDIIKDNFTHIASAIGNRHIWSVSDATLVVHKFAVGTITRAMTAASGAIDETLTFTPTLVIFNAHLYMDNPASYIYRFATSLGGSDGSKNSCIYRMGTGSTAGSTDTLCIYLISTTTSDYQRAVCTFDTNKFILTWTLNGSPAAQAANIFYIALRL